MDASPTDTIKGMEEGNRDFLLRACVPSTGLLLLDAEYYQLKQCLNATRDSDSTDWSINIKF